MSFTQTINRKIALVDMTLELIALNAKLKITSDFYVVTGTDDEYLDQVEMLDQTFYEIHELAERAMVEGSWFVNQLSKLVREKGISMLRVQWKYAVEDAKTVIFKELAA